MTRDEAFRRYEETLAEIKKRAHREREEARFTLQGQLKVLRDTLHEELRAVRAIQQKTKGGGKR